jgi:hypothetical protein
VKAQEMFATRASSKQQFLPILIAPNELKNQTDKINIIALNQKSNGNKLYNADNKLSSSIDSNGGALQLDALFRVPQTLTNSALVHQRVSATPGSTVGDHLAVASAQTGASLPLMIGNRSKCLVNVLDQQQQQQQQQSPPAHQHLSQNQSQTNPVQLLPPNVGPQNTALRAEQRRQNMSVSVVRPVVVVNSADSTQADSLGAVGKCSSALIDEWMAFDRACSNLDGPSKRGTAPLDELLFAIKTSGSILATSNYGGSSPPARQPKSEQILAMVRREQHELNRNIIRQHQFMMDKLEERKRYLAIVQSVWFQRDFKHAIEKLVDIYHQGLIFMPENNSSSNNNHNHNSNNNEHQLAACKLKSLNTSLVVDVISIIILRPKLWTLEVCQLLLPIINQDLLMQNQYEYYTEIGFKALKLILAHFSSIIASTLESLKEPNKLVGVDLSREDRINKCLACYKLLLESRTVINEQQHWRNTQKHHHKQSSSASSTLHNNHNDGQQCKLASIQRELQAMFASLFSSIQLEPSVLARRFCG